MKKVIVYIGIAAVAGLLGFAVGMNRAATAQRPVFDLVQALAACRETLMGTVNAAIQVNQAALTATPALQAVIQAINGHQACARTALDQARTALAGGAAR